MYFKEKEDTNIDSEFNSKRKLNLNLKPLLLIGGGIILLLIIIFIMISIVSNLNKYSLELLGDPEITINLGEDYKEPGYVAYYKNKKLVIDQVKVTSNLDNNKVGKYEINYTIDNITRVRIVSVVNNKDLYIFLLGDVNMKLKQGEKYQEPGFNVYDSVDKDIKNNVIITGNVDTSKKGTYQITYTVTNSRNSTVSAVRTIVVE